VNFYVIYIWTAGFRGLTFGMFVFRLEQELSAGTKMNSRILVVTGSADSASQYMNYMNVFFTAQKQVTTLEI